MNQANNSSDIVFGLTWPTFPRFRSNQLHIRLCEAKIKAQTYLNACYTTR